MQGKEPVLCPLCGAAVRARATQDEHDVRALDRHFAAVCPIGAA